MAPPDTPASTTAAPSSQQPPQEPATPPPPYHGTPAVQHNIALAAAIIGPIGLLLPGRGRGTFSLQNMTLGAGSFLGINQLAHDYTGKSVLQRSNDRWASILRPFDTLPEKALANKALMEAERARRAAALPVGERSAAEAEMRRKEEVRERAQRGLLERVWMGEEREGWQERRRDEDRKAMEGGKGIGDIIIDQIKEVWNGSGKKGEGKEEGDTQVEGSDEDGRKD